MKKEILLFPFGGNSREALGVLRDINKIQQEWEVIGFIDDDQTLWGKTYDGVKVLGGKEQLDKTPQAFVLAVPGNPHNYLHRKTIIGSLHIEASRWAKVVHPSVVVFPEAEIGFNTLIMAHVVVSAHTGIGNHCVILPNTTISHDSVIEDYCCVGSNVSISGGVRVGENAYIGSGTSIREDITIQEKVLVGLGSNIVRDVASNVVVVGNPAKILRKF